MTPKKSKEKENTQQHITERIESVFSKNERKRREGG